MELIKRVNAAVAALKGVNLNGAATVSGQGGSKLDAVWVPGTNINWDTATADVVSCPGVQACFNFMSRNLPQATPSMMEQDAKGKWQEIPGHPVTNLLTRPNPFYDGSVLMNQIAFSLQVKGNAYLLIERTKGGEPVELWWWPHHWVDFPPDNTDDIPYYILRDRKGFRRNVFPEDIIHLKYGLNPDDFRFGLSPLGSISRDTFTLQMAVNYRANILRNFGVAGRTYSPKDGAISINDPAGLKSRIDAQIKGDGVGSTLVLTQPMDIKEGGVTPQQMALDTMEDRPEANVCALFGFPIQVIGLHGGRESKTYANASDAREQAWEEGLMPLANMIACQLGYSLIPNWESNRAAQGKYKLAMDYSAVRSLQPDLDKLATRWVAIWKTGGCTLEQFAAALNMEKPEPALAKLRYFDLAGSGKADPNADPTPVDDNAKGFKVWTDRIDEEIEALERLVAA